MVGCVSRRIPTERPVSRFAVCRGCGLQIVKELPADPWFHADTGEVCCELADGTLSEQSATPTGR